MAGTPSRRRLGFVSRIHPLSGCMCGQSCCLCGFVRLKLASEAVSGEREAMAVEVADPPAQWLHL